jgi:hypothetical protein
MKKVFVVFECVPYEGEYVRGIYLSSEDAEVRKKYLDDNCYFKVDYEVRELGVGVDLESV